MVIFYLSPLIFPQYFKDKDFGLIYYLKHSVYDSACHNVGIYM